MFIPVVLDIHVPAPEFSMKIDRKVMSDGAFAGFRGQQVSVALSEVIYGPADSMFDFIAGERRRRDHSFASTIRSASDTRNSPDISLDRSASRVVARSWDCFSFDLYTLIDRECH